MKISDIRRGTAEVEAGAWISDIPNLPGISLFTRGVQNQDWINLEQRLMQSRVRQASMNYIPSHYCTISASAAAAITNSCLHQTCLRDWRGLDEPYNFELAGKLIFESEFWLFRAGVLWAAEQVGRPSRMGGIVPIITEATIINGILSLTSVDGDTIEDFERGGRMAGEECGLSYEKVYGRNSNADPSRFPAALRDAMSDACRSMRDHGADDANVGAWHSAFLDAARPFISNIDAMFGDAKTVDGVTVITLPTL